MALMNNSLGTTSMQHTTNSSFSRAGRSPPQDFIMKSSSSVQSLPGLNGFHGWLFCSVFGIKKYQLIVFIYLFIWFRGHLPGVEPFFVFENVKNSVCLNWTTFLKFAVFWVKICKWKRILPGIWLIRIHTLSTVEYATLCHSFVILMWYLL